MIYYPTLKKDFTIGVTAPSSGIDPEFHYYIDEIKKRFERDHKLIIGDTVYTQKKAKSADALIRADELNTFLTSDEIGIVIPPWGGDLAIEILDKLNFQAFKPKWMLGYSDTSLILLALTLKTGIATAHGTNIVDLRGKFSDETTKRWIDILGMSKGDSIEQVSSKMYQSEWSHDNSTDYVFNFDRETEWKTFSGNSESFEGRLLGGCIDVIYHLIGTPYGNVEYFRNHFINNEPDIWYLENCESSPVEVRRMLVQMHYAGWFKHCNGIMFGRTSVDFDVDGYTMTDVYHDIEKDLGIPVIYDIDCGHMPPQITLVNGAYAKVQCANGKGSITQTFI